jgi:hypothetical protein
MKNGEKGQALVIVLALVAFGGLVIAPFLGNVGSSLIGSRLYGEAISQQYSSDAGVEHASWGLTYSNLADQLPSPGDSISYQLGEAVNGIAPYITVSKGWEVIATDNFESGGWLGGTGWLYDWSPSGEASVIDEDDPYEGNYHLRLMADTGYVERAVDLSGLYSASLRFQAKVRSFEGQDEARCFVSENGNDWVEVRVWDNSDDDNTYHFYDIDLSLYALTSQFWIAFEADMGDTNDYFYVDDLKVVNTFDAIASVARDDFESGDWSGGTGWLDDWYHEGNASVTTSGTPYEGSYHLLLTSSDGYVKRSVDLSSLSAASLQLQAKVSSFEGSNKALCLISENGDDWIEVYTWDSKHDDDTYHLYDINLSSYNLTSQFWIAFDAEMGWTDDYFYVDDLKIKGEDVYGIRSVANDWTIWSVVQIVGETVKVLWWQVT